jgi:hypothetical protein
MLHRCGIAYMATTLPIPDAVRVLPVSALHHLVNRFGAVAVVTAGPLHDPTGALRPDPEQRPSRLGRLH